MYRLFFEATGDALMAVSLPECQLQFVNPSFMALTGYARDEVVGESLAVLNPMGDGGATRDRRIDVDMLSMPGFYNDVALATRDGQLRYVGVKITHADLDGRKMALAVISDDTERQLLVRDLTTKHQSLETAYLELEKMHRELKETQDKMVQASKLVALGELAAGMSHELNQPLTGIRGFAQEIQDILRTNPKPKKSVVRELCAHIVSNSDKMASLLSHLREFARKGRENAESENSAAESVPLAEAVHNVKTLLGRQLEKQQIRVEESGLDAGLCVVARMHPVEQVLINLITNSRDSLADVARVNPKFRGRIQISAAREEGFAVLRVSDNGAGVPEHIRNRIFDPFFSTKDTGKGMGLGLSISFGIAHKFGGELKLESSGAAGTTFALRLPLAAQARRAA